MMMMMMKREREVDSTTMANYLMLLSRGNEILQASSSSSSRVFECKTCNRQFSSFQALGGHRASHKKPRLMADGSSEEEQLHLLHGSSSPPKPKTHECSICGLEFAIGQALGGHMRRHRATTLTAATSTSFDNRNSSSSQSADGNNKKPTNNSSSKRKRSSSSSPSPSSVLFLDLNLTPFENDLEFFKIGQPSTTPTLVHCFN